MLYVSRAAGLHSLTDFKYGVGNGEREEMYVSGESILWQVLFSISVFMCFMGVALKGGGFGIEAKIASYAKLVYNSFNVVFGHWAAINQPETNYIWA